LGIRTGKDLFVELEKECMWIEMGEHPYSDLAREKVKMTICH